MALKSSELIRAIKACIEAKIVVIIWGPPGCGKSDTVGQATEQLRYDFVVWHPVVSDPTDFKGLPMTVDGKALFMPFGGLTRLIEADKPLVVFLDDLGQATPSVQAALMQLILAREIDGVRISDHVRFVCASNRVDDKAGVGRMLTPLLNRCVHMEFEVDVPDWLVWAAKNNVDNRVRGYIASTQQSNTLHRFDPKTAAVERAFATPRSWAMLSTLLKTCPDSLLLDLAKGTVGDAAGCAFVQYVKVYHQVPDPALVTRDPKTAPIVDDSAIQWGYIGAVAMLARYASPMDLESIAVYAGRLPEEFGVLMMKCACGVAPAILDTKTGNEFCRKHKLAQAA